MKIAHFGIHEPGNAGDTLLFIAVRRLFERFFGKIEWALENVRDKVTEETVERVNACDAMIIGGGGLFIKDTNKNPNSGWQWNCYLPLLRAIKVPIIVFGIGYNRFRGQEEFETVFRRHVRQLAKQADFFGMRNHGSIRETKKYLETDKSKICYQPCPTVFTKRLFPEYFPGIIAERTIAINMAFDRLHLRYGNRWLHVANQVVELCRALTKENYDVHIVSHCGDDYAIAHVVDYEGVPVIKVNLNEKPVDRVVAYYAGVPITIGVRGHAQLIPFGCEQNIISLISHNKVKWFLQDIGHEEFGVEVTTPDITATVMAKVKYIERYRERIAKEFEESRERLWDATVKNMRAIANII